MGKVIVNSIAFAVSFPYICIIALNQQIGVLYLIVSNEEQYTYIYTCNAVPR